MSHAIKKGIGEQFSCRKHWPQMELEFRCGLVRRVWSDLVWFADPWCPNTLQTCLTGRIQGLGRCVCNQIVCSASAAQVSWNGSATDLPQPQLLVMQILVQRDSSELGCCHQMKTRGFAITSRVRRQSSLVSRWGVGSRRPLRAVT